MRFQDGSRILNKTKQPLTVPERFKEGRYLRLKVGAIDGEERGDSKTLGFVSIGEIVVEICTAHRDLPSLAQSPT